MKPDFFTKYEATLLPAAQAALDAQQQGTVRRSKRFRATPFAVAFGLLVAGGALAGSGLLPIGSEVPVVQRGGKHEPARLGGRIVVATGRTPVHGRWQIFWSRSSVGDCVALQLLDDPSSPGIGEGCGRRTAISASALLPIPGAKRPVETLVYGRVPDSARTVRVTLPGLGTREGPATAGPSAVTGNWYLISFPAIPRSGRGIVTALDGKDASVGRRLGFPVSLHPRYPPPPVHYSGGSRVVVTPSGYAQVLLSCKRQPRHEGKCIGTLSIRVRRYGLASCRHAGTRVRCGWRFFRLAPGTVDRRLRVRLGREVLVLLRRRGSVPARLRYGGHVADVTLTSSG